MIAVLVGNQRVVIVAEEHDDSGYSRINHWYFARHADALKEDRKAEREEADA